MTSPDTLSSDDFCSRQVYFLERWQAPARTPKSILVAAVEHGLTSESEDAASDEAMRLCTDGAIDTAETDLLGLAEHIAGLADILAWIVRGEHGPWTRPESIAVGTRMWHSGAFLNQSGRGLRKLVLVDRWDAWRETELRNAWSVQGECAAYDVPMSVIVCAIGSMRKGRWTSPFTSGWRHPVGKMLRFQKRDGEAFSASWDRVHREHDKATREEWLDAMTEDGALEESISVVSVDVPERAEAIAALAERKLVRITTATNPPDPQPSRCFDRMRPCPFRSECPQGHEPNEVRGFRLLS